jgi:asparagine synthase (glutamine-hydrolysing)
MGAYLAARGPDDEVALQRPDFRLVFRRLSIVDVPGGRQPFHSADGRFIAVVNGEIYNHRELARQYLSGVSFATGSDCEVVLHLFRAMGAAFLSRLNGIYAIAIWDCVERRLLLARDRLGVKPLYYAVIGDGLVFASELCALLAHPRAPRSIDWGAFRHVPGSTFPFDRPAGRPVSTGIQGVAFVAPATYFEWHYGCLQSPVTYWHPDGVAPDDPRRSLDDYVDEYAALLTDSIRIQLMSDLPVGVFLSGGLDSSIITAIAARHRADLTAFTLAEPSIAATGDTAAAVELAAQLDVPLHLVRVDQAALDATIRLDLATLEHFVWIMDFPLFDVEFLFKHELHRYAKCHDPALKVVLLGQGADEFAGGYSRLGSANWAAFAEREAEAMRFALLRERGIPTPYQPYVGPSAAHALETTRLGRHEAWQYLRFGDLAAYNLWHEDRTAAANGIESRVPFLDHRLVEFLCAIPIDRRAELFFDKAIARRAAARFLPAGLAERPKVPLFRRMPGTHDSVSELYRAFVRTAYPAFRDKYLTADALFSAPALDALRDQAITPQGGEVEHHLLLRCMAICVFDHLCRDAARNDFSPPRLAAGPPLAASSLPQPVARVFAPDSRVALFDGVRLAVSCDDSPALLVIKDGVLTAQIGMPHTIDGDLLQVFAGRSFELGGLAQALGVDDVTPLAEAFLSRGWGFVVNGAE